MNRIGLIHATPLAVQPIAASFAALWPQARLHNILDDSLSVDRARDGRLTEAMTQRFIDLSHYAVGCGCEALLFTCSAFGPAIEAAAARSGVPTFKPNEAMFDAALAVAPADAVLRIGLLATFEPSIESMAQELQARASGRGLGTAGPNGGNAPVGDGHIGVGQALVPTHGDHRRAAQDHRAGRLRARERHLRQR